MEDDEDDLYGGAGRPSAEPEAGAAPTNGEAAVKNEEDGSEEEESSDDEIQITTERPEGAKSESVQPARAASVKPTLKHERSPSSTTAKPSKVAKTESSKPDAKPSSTPAATSSKLTTTLTHNGKEGKDFPDVQTSTIDLASVSPNWPGTNKPITLLDIDADLAEHSKPWRLPGTDQTDFFNYGFDEYTWTQYCVKQQSMAGTIAQQREQDAQMKAMLGMGGDSGPGNNGPGGGMPGGMPGMDQMMQMMAGGMDPSKMDMGAFMQMMGGGPQPPSGPGGFGGQGGASPFPPNGQGFQPPSGPGGGGGGMGMGMDGFSPQQMAIMEQQQQGPMGGGGRGRGRRGRGFY